MGNHKLRGKDLSKIGINQDHIRSIIIDIAGKYCKHESKNDIINIVNNILQNPQAFQNHEFWNKLAKQYIEQHEEQTGNYYELNENEQIFRVIGRELINSNAWLQMDMAMRLPVSIKGALMPDAHLGYGLPIGGVLATKNAVIPYGVGVDIGCMMHLSVFPEGENYLNRFKHKLKEALKAHTWFGTGVEQDLFSDHAILEHHLFTNSPLLRKLKGKAAKQLGTSGSGNHFVEFGRVELEKGNPLQLAPGNYLGLLSHSGSRGLGAEIAKHYTQIALDQCILPKGARHLAWLDLNTEAGQEYWQSMKLACDYARASHDTIHRRLANALGIQASAQVQCIHNSADIEMVNGEKLVIHRKGATPAALGTTGIIPGSMSAPGFLVQGKGYEVTLNSASHGAGRKLSRDKAKNSISGSMMRKHLKENGIHLIGGSTDEAPMAYKDIHRIIELQQKQIDVFGKFQPKIVRMDKA